MSPKIKRSRGLVSVAPHSKYSRKVFFEYSPGETSFQLGYLGSDKSTVEGILRLRYTEDKPIFAKKITISFTGKEFVQFAGTLEEGQDIGEDDESEYNEEEVSTTTISTHTAKRKFFNNDITIWRSQSKGHYEGIKYLDLPFKFNLPDNLPPSVTIDGGCGRIYYVLKAVISRRPIDPNSRKIAKMIKYVIPVVRYTITPHPKPIYWFKKGEGPAKHHVLDHDVSVTRSTFNPGESVVVPIKLTFREPQIYLKKIFVGLKEYHELRTEKYVTLTKGYVTEETIKASTIPISHGPDNEYFVEVKFNVPSERGIIYDVDTAYLSVSHKLKVKVQLGKAPDLHLSNFVKIEKIVSKEEVFPSPPLTINIPQEVITVHEPIVVKSKRESYRRLSPFFPLFNKVQNGDISTKKFPFQQLQVHITDSKNPSMIYNSRSLLIPSSQIKQSQQNKQSKQNRIQHFDQSF
uniref:Arrestin domain-containing protein C584.15c n=1 Tax=Anthurium amnicola TaxID=1678845 RepID=A0A1D1YU92_9ARAE